MSALTVLLVTLLAPAVHGVKTYDTGSGIVYKLGMKQDVTLERGSSNFNYLEYLIVSKHPGYPNKRSLVQFEDLPSTCPTPQIESAKMYLYYEYAHKASFSSISRVPFIPRYLEVYLVRKPWNEAQTTSTMRLIGTPWSSPWLGLDGTDAEATPQQGTVIIFPSRPKGFIEFDVTNAVRSWSDGVANNGLVIRATNELDPGRDIRFASHAMSDSSKHAFVLVRCEGEYRIRSATSSATRYHPTTYQHYTVREEKRFSTGLRTPWNKDDDEPIWFLESAVIDDEPNRQLQKCGSGCFFHKRSSMAFFSAFLVSIVFSLA